MARAIEMKNDRYVGNDRSRIAYLFIPVVRDDGPHSGRIPLPGVDFERINQSSIYKTGLTTTISSFFCSSPREQSIRGPVHWILGRDSILSFSASSWTQLPAGNTRTSRLSPLTLYQQTLKSAPARSGSYPTILDADLRLLLGPQGG